MEHAITESKSIAASPLAKSEAPSIGAMMQMMIAKGITEQNVKAFEAMVALQERVEDRQAERDFAQAFVALQADMPNIKAQKEVHNSVEKGGGVRYTFAPFEDLMSQVAPLLKKHGFTITFSTDYAEGRIIKTCTLQHIGGHSKTNKFAARVGKGPPGASETQGDGAASTYAKRFALMDALNIVVKGLDNDARLEGGSITWEQAEDFRQRVKETKSDEKRFLKLAGAETYETIPAVKRELLDAMLKMK